MGNHNTINVEGKRFIELCDIFDSFDGANDATVVAILPECFASGDDVLLADALEFVGAFGKREFRSNVLFALNNSSELVRSAAYEALYDLDGSLSLASVKNGALDPHFLVRTSCTVLLYLITNDLTYVGSIQDLLSESNWDDRYCARVFYMLKQNLEPPVNSKVLEVFDVIRTNLPPNDSTVGDINDYLKTVR